MSTFRLSIDLKMFVPYFWELGLIKIILPIIDSKTIIFDIVQFGAPPYLGASVPLAYSPYLTGGLVSPLLGSDQLQHHHQPHHQHHQPHHQAHHQPPAMQNKQRAERIEVSDGQSNPDQASKEINQENTGLSHHTKL